jgi:hypothetical protein
LALLACAAASLAGAGCDPDRSRGGPATSVRIEPARARASGEGAVASRAAAGGRAASSPVASDSVSRGSARHPDDGHPAPAVERAGAWRSAASPTDDSITAASDELEPGVNEEFDPDILLDIDEALAAVDENAFAMLFKKVQVLVDGELVKKEKFAHPDNCRRWRGLRNKGYAPKSALGKQIDAGALVRCGALEFLAKARSSRRSHVRNLLAGAGPGALPAIVASAASPLAEQARDRAVARGASLAEFLPSARTIPSELPGRLSIAEPSSESSVILNAEAWGDVNGDGIEDLVLSVLNTADDATYYGMRLVQVTRLSPSSPLAVLAVQE